MFLTLYIQEGSANIWKKIVLEDLEAETLEYGTIREFLADLKKEFSGGDNEIIKVAELKKIEQGNRIIEKFVQEFRKVIKESKYKERLLVEEFKRRMNRLIRRKLIEVERSSKIMEQWYKKVTNLDKY